MYNINKCTNNRFFEFYANDIIHSFIYSLQLTKESYKMNAGGIPIYSYSKNNWTENRISKLFIQHILSLKMDYFTGSMALY